MLKDFFINWIIFQLLIIGGTGGYISGKMEDGTFICSTNNNGIYGDIAVGVVLPLIFFMPEDKNITEYCNNQLSLKNNY